jgi:hypothetical protein
VSEALYHDILNRVASLKVKLIAAFPHHLWKYDFVHRWISPDAVTPEAFVSETNLFSDSFRCLVPLDDPPAREYYDCEEALSPFPAWDFAPKAGIGSLSDHHYASGATKKKFKPKKKSKQKPKKR